MLRRAALGLAGLALLVAGCAPRGAAAAPEWGPNVSDGLPVQAVVDPVDPADPRLGPAAGEAEVGKTYPFDLYTHCGVEYAAFAGRIWRAAEPRPEPPGRPDADGMLIYSGYTAGTMTLVSDHTARFVMDERYADVRDPVVDFRLSDEPMPTCR